VHVWPAGRALAGRPLSPGGGSEGTPRGIGRAPETRPPANPGDESRDWFALSPRPYDTAADGWVTRVFDFGFDPVTDRYAESS